MSLKVLVGRSSSGKDTIARELINKGYKRIISHTTRPMRVNESHGVDYWFESYVGYDDTLCLKSYKVANNEVWRYWFDKNEIISAIHSNETYIAIADPEGCKELHQLGADIIFVYVPVETSLERYYLRESKNKNPDYKEVIRRVLADSKDFEVMEREALVEGKYKIVSNYDRKLSDVVDCVERMIKNDRPS